MTIYTTWTDLGAVIRHCHPTLEAAREYAAKSWKPLATQIHRVTVPDGVEEVCRLLNDDWSNAQWEVVS